jgi:riboflavin synthase
MFTGIITHTGLVRALSRGKSELAVEAPAVAPRLGVGDSVSVNGVCLTVARKDGGILFFNLSKETLERTTLRTSGRGDAVHLELPMILADPLGGHLVSGHIDFKAKIVRNFARPPGRRLVFALPLEFRPFFVPKGSVAVNGVSLTVAALGPASFEAELIPVTLEKTQLGKLKPGDDVNIECDMIGKYVYNRSLRYHR